MAAGGLKRRNLFAEISANRHFQQAQRHGIQQQSAGQHAQVPQRNPHQHKTHHPADDDGVQQVEPAGKYEYHPSEHKAPHPPQRAVDRLGGEGQPQRLVMPRPVRFKQQLIAEELRQMPVMSMARRLLFITISSVMVRCIIPPDGRADERSVVCRKRFFARTLHISSVRSQSI